MIRVLVFGMTENPGGVESCIINYYRHINRSAIQFDFLCNSYEKVAYEEELIELGGNVFYIAARSKNPRKYKTQLEKVFREHASEWNAIWVNVCSLANIDYLKVAKKYGIKRRIIHSHNSRNMDGKLRGLLHFWNKTQLKKYATDFWACSKDAAHWFYSNELINRVVIIHNAIDVNRMKFDNEKQNNIREEHGWKDKYLIGNIGRLHFQKNQSFMLDVFVKYHTYNKDSVLVLVGQGEDEDKLRTKAKEIGIDESVYFAGVQNDVQAWLSSFDLFLFPSLFEGLGIAALEAQANGLPVLASDKVIPKEVKMNPNFEFWELDKTALQWAEKIHEMTSKYFRINNNTVLATFIKKGYEINSEIKKLERLLTD